MGTAPINPGNIDPIDLMVEVIEEHSPESIWRGSRLEGYRQLGNTNRGQIGEDFVRRYLSAANIPVSNGSRTSPTDLVISGQHLRSQDRLPRIKRNISVQPRPPRPHLQLPPLPRHLPRQNRLQRLAERVISEGGAGSLVRMAEGQSTTHKLTKRLVDMRPIGELIGWVREDAQAT